MKTGKIISSIIILFLSAFYSSAQQKFDGIVSFDSTVKDFGDIMTSDGPVSCTFTLTNISDKDIKISSVISSCGCTDVSWTRDIIKPGLKGTVAVTYKNEDGPYPFDKSVSVYISGIKSPIVLRLRGIAHEKKLPAGEMYPVHMNGLGLKSTDFKCGNLQQGQTKSESAKIANIGNVPVKVEFKDVSAGLALKVNPNPIPAGETADLVFSVSADRSKWGRNDYHATPVVNGKVQTKQLTIHATTKENFSGWTKDQKDNAANILFDSSTFSFKPMAAGPTVKASFELTNVGKSDLVIYKVDSDNPKCTTGNLPGSVKKGEKATLNVSLDTKGMSKGEVLVIVTLYTNSPLRPIVNLYITGFIQ